MFSSVLSNVEKQWGDRGFRTSGEILHVSGLYLALSKLGLYDRKLEDILEECRTYITEIKVSGAWNGFSRDQFRLTQGDQWGGLGYAGQEIEDFRKIELYLEEKLKEAELERLPQAGETLLETLRKDPNKFRRMVTLCNSDDQLYFGTPILKHIEPKDFLKALIALPNSEKKWVAYALEDRYKYDEIASKLIDEMDFLKTLEIEMSAEIDRRKGKVSSHILQITKSYLRKALAQLEKVGKAEK